MMIPNDGVGLFHAWYLLAWLDGRLDWKWVFGALLFL